MSIDNIVIPGGILAAWNGPAVAENGDGPETFDITQVARQRARTLSVSFVGPELASRGGRSRFGDVLVSNQSTQAPVQRRSSSTHDQDTQAQGLQRARTINLGNLGSLGATGRKRRPTDPGPRLERTASWFGSAKLKAKQGTLQLDGISALNDTYVFQSLGNTTSSGDTAFQDSRHRPTRNDSDTTLFSRGRRTSSPGKIERNQSDASQFSTINVVRRASIIVENAVGKVKDTVTGALRRSSLEEVYEKAKIRQLELQRSNAAQTGFEYTFYLFLLAIIYFVIVGVPFWDGLVLTIYHIFDMKLVVPAGTAAFLGTGFLYAYLPLLVLFEKEPPEQFSPAFPGQTKYDQASDTALLIPCYKSEKLISATLEAALKVFPAQNIFVIANGNSPTPLDNTAAVCESYGVSHTWSPIGSKIVAQFVGCYIAQKFPNVLLIDDDCLLPPNFPIVTERLSPTVKCIGYTIKSVGPNSSKGTLCQQAQDVEYKISGIQRAFAGKIGSATFPHGAISIWDRELLIKTFQEHPGFSVSEDWFFGHVARQLGCRIQMCTAVFVETETPDAIFFSGGGDRGGFGEMTVWKQRFFRWNFFFISGIYYDLSYMLWNWKLGWWEFGAKLFVFQEVYETLLYILAPFVLPISFYVRPNFSGYLFAGTILLYLVNVVIFNYVHLRRRHESVSVLCLMYYVPYKLVLTFVNIASCYYSIYKYAKYFAKRHPKIIEDEKAVAVVLRLEEQSYSAKEKAAIVAGRSSVDSVSQLARRFTVTAVGTNLSSIAQGPLPEAAHEEIEVVDFATRAAPQLASVPEGRLPEEPGADLGPRIWRAPPPMPARGRPFSWHRSTSNNSSGSNVSPLDERKKLQFPTVSPSDERKKLQFPNVSPSDERKIPQYPLASSELGPLTEEPLTEEPLSEEPSTEQHPPVTRQPSPAFFRRSRSSSLLCGVPSWPAPLTLHPIRAPSQHPTAERPMSSLSRRSSSAYSTLSYSMPSPSIGPPPAAVSHQPREFTVVSSALDVGGGWPLRRAPGSDDALRYGVAGDSRRWSERSRRSKGRVVITEGGGGGGDRESLVLDSTGVDQGGSAQEETIGKGRLFTRNDDL
ncbi:MAG: hypothetical protein LQ344_006723 [Seirophora lacunosa]|nr:MAG: hypothetical protein LQ344_006723 [Seirophora lacunosa]